MRTGRPEHLKTFSYTGLHRYSLTFCTHRRQQLLARAAVVDRVLAQISRAAAEHRFAIVAYCFMPDHLHLLIEGTSDGSDCKAFVARAKQYSGFGYSREFHGILWQRYSFEHVIRDEEIAVKVARYILENPIRAGLVSRVADYPFAGSLVYSLEDVLEGTARSG